MEIRHQNISRRPKNTRTLSGSENGISRLLSAAVVNRRFQDTLLTDPERALAQGYLGERFELDPEEKALILGIRAESLADFARQLRSRRYPIPIRPMPPKARAPPPYRWTPHRRSPVHQSRPT